MKRLLRAWSLFCGVCVAITAGCWWLLLALLVTGHLDGGPR